LQDSAYAIKSLFIKYGSSKSKGYPPSAVRKADTPEKIRWMMLQCIRGIGPKTAKRILEEYNLFSPYEQLDIDYVIPERLKKVKGLNKRSKELLIQVFKG